MVVARGAWGSRLKQKGVPQLVGLRVLTAVVLLLYKDGRRPPPLFRLPAGPQHLVPV